MEAHSGRKTKGGEGEKKILLSRLEKGCSTLRRSRESGKKEINRGSAEGLGRKLLLSKTKKKLFDLLTEPDPGGKKKRCSSVH